MDKQRIWAPWRIGYIAPDRDQTDQDNTERKETDLLQETLEPVRWQAEADKSCFLCRSSAVYASQPDADQQNLVVWQGQHMIALLNRYPYTNGHLLISPRRHVADLDTLSDQEHLEGMRILGHFTRLLKDLFEAHGFNIGLNLGPASRGGCPGTFALAPGSALGGRPQFYANPGWDSRDPSVT